ncbi:MAG: hypothetical protein QM778_30145 [Myxococcales bacterium]
MVQLVVSSAAAETAQAPALDDAQVRARLLWIEGAFARERLHAQIWWYGWFAAAAVDTTVSAVYYARANTRLERDVWLTSWIGGVLWIGQLSIFPMVPAFASRRISRMPRRTPEERARALAKAEHLLKRAAEDEEEGRSVVEHLLDGAWALSTGIYIFLRNYDFGEGGTHHNRQVWLQASLEVVWNLAVTEIAIWTQPTQSVDNYRERPWAMQPTNGPGSFAPPSVASAQRRLSLRVGIDRVTARLTF